MPSSNPLVFALAEYALLGVWLFGCWGLGRRLLPGGGTVTGASVPAAGDPVEPLAHPMVLHTVTLGRQEAKRLVYLSIPATRGAARDAPAPLATAGPLDAARAQGRPA